MTKLRHDRSSLRYLDNLRRELARESRSVPAWFEQTKALELVGNETVLLNQHIQAFSKLPERQQIRMNHVVECFGKYIEAQSETISRLLTKTSKKLRIYKDDQESAFQDLVTAGAVLMQDIISDEMAKRDGVWQWYKAFYKDLDDQAKLTWSELSSIFSDDCLPLYAGWLLEERPETLKEFMATNNGAVTI